MRAVGLEALLKTGMINIMLIVVERNNNPQFLNLQFKYPNSLKAVVANDIDVYSLDKDINPSATVQVRVLQLKTYSFTE